MTTVTLRTPQQLYEDWEDGRWGSREIDLAQDQADWSNGGLEGEERELVLWALSSLIVAEERITTQFSSLVMAYDDEEEESYLATQQVDEALHMQFYARYRNQVIADPETIGAHVSRARESLGVPFKTIFDEALVNVHRRLASDPANHAAKIDFITIYHMVIEGTLGIAANHFITDFLVRRGVLPGFVDGYTRIAHDEQRHIAYGTWYLQQAVTRDPAVADAIRAQLAALLPAVAQALSPPGAPEANADEDPEVLGVRASAVREFALGALTRRLKIIGAPLG